MPSPARTTISSIRVNPLALNLLLFFIWLMFRI
jgi:hypothetical protein